MMNDIKIYLNLYMVAGVYDCIHLRVMKMRKNIVLPKDFTITAHTGCMKTEENSLESFKSGIENGANIVEFDLYFTKNGEPVLSHNEPVGGEVSLDEAFEYLSEFKNIGINVDVKTCDALEKVYPTAQKYGVGDRIFYTGVKDEFVEPVRQNSPEVKYFLNMSVKKSKDKEYLMSLVEKVKNAGAIGINFKYTGATKELVKVFHENGLLVSIWTVNSKWRMKKILSSAPDNITTRHPDKLSGIVKDFQ